MKIGRRNIIKAGTDKMIQIIQTAKNERVDVQLVTVEQILLCCPTKRI